MLWPSQWDGMRSPAALASFSILPLSMDLACRLRLIAGLPARFYPLGDVQVQIEKYENKHHKRESQLKKKNFFYWFLLSCRLLSVQSKSYLNSTQHTLPENAQSTLPFHASLISLLPIGGLSNTIFLKQNFKKSIISRVN
jgi:hypothetical protein